MSCGLVKFFERLNWILPAWNWKHSPFSSLHWLWSILNSFVLKFESLNVKIFFFLFFFYIYLGWKNSVSSIFILVWLFGGLPYITAPCFVSFQINLFSLLAAEFYSSASYRATFYHFFSRFSFNFNICKNHSINIKKSERIDTFNLIDFFFYFSVWIHF